MIDAIASESVGLALECRADRRCRHRLRSRALRYHRQRRRAVALRLARGYRDRCGIARRTVPEAVVSRSMFSVEKPHLHWPETCVCLCAPAPQGAGGTDARDRTVRGACPRVQISSSMDRDGVRTAHRNEYRSRHPLRGAYRCCGMDTLRIVPYTSVSRRNAASPEASDRGHFFQHFRRASNHVYT